MNHRSLDGSDSIHPVGGPMTLKLNAVFVNFHAGAPGGEEAPPRPLDTVFIPNTAPRVNETSPSLNNLQLAKDIILII